MPVLNPFGTRDMSPPDAKPEPGPEARSALKLYNTLTRTREPFTPLDPDHLRMYVCGPTVYDFAHIGNARPMIVFDVLFRLLRHLARQGAFDGGAGQTRVTYARNITDVDDKINARAFQRWSRKRPLLDEMRDLTEGTVAQFNADLKALNVLEPTHTPRATDFVANGEQPMDMVRIIAKLVERGVAYEAEGHVLFSPSSMDALPGVPKYGALSKRNFDDMLAGARVDVAPYKRDPMDFVLWKPSNPETEPGWDSPWGFGRPGWHIECSAMAGALLGEQFDIHGGGIDLVFPHHENEIAQSCCAFGIEKMASVWMHNGFLQVEGRKMSKSDGNFVTIHELLHTDTFGGHWWSGSTLRLAMLSAHYRQPIDWTARRLEEFATTEVDFRFRLQDVMQEHSVDLRDVGPEFVDPKVLDALLDDLNTSAVITRLRALARIAGEEKFLEAGQRLAASLKLLGFEVPAPEKEDAQEDFGFAAEVYQLIERRNAARRAKNFAESDRIRDELAAMGIALKDGKDPVTGEPTTSWEVKR